jgi:hypothetical protein
MTTKTRLSMEAMRDIDRVVGAIGRISMSKARELTERIVFDDLRLEELDPAELGQSDTARIDWLVNASPSPMTGPQVAAAVGREETTVAPLLCRLVKQRRIAKVRGGYARRLL